MYVYCLPLYVKANRYLLSSASGTLKNAPHKSITVKYVASGGIWSAVCVDLQLLHACPPLHRLQLLGHVSIAIFVCQLSALEANTHTSTQDPSSE